MSGKQKRSQEQCAEYARGLTNATPIERSVYTSSSDLFFCIWDVTEKKMFFAFSSCLGFQNWGAHLCAQGMWGEQQTFQTSPASTVKKLSLVRRRDKGSHFLAFKASLASAQPPPLESGALLDDRASHENFLNFCLRIKPLTPESILSFWEQKVHHSSELQEQICVLRDLCHQVLSFSRSNDLCFDECITCLWFLRTLCKQQPCLPCSLADCTRYLAAALGQRMVLISSQKARPVDTEAKECMLVDTSEKKLPKLPTVLKTLKKPLKSSPTVRDVLDPYTKCLALCQEAKDEDDPNSEENILLFQAFLVKRLRYYFTCYRQQSLERVCTQTKLIARAQHRANIQAALILPTAPRKVLTPPITDYTQEITAASSNSSLACNPEYLKYALLNLSGSQGQKVSVLQLVPELRAWLRGNKSEDLAKPSQFLYTHFPALVTAVMELYQPKNAMTVAEPVVKMEKGPSFFRHQNFQDQSQLLLSVFGAWLGSVFPVPPLGKAACMESPLITKTPCRPSQSSQRSPTIFAWMVPKEELLRFRKLWLCLCLAFDKPPAYQTIFTKPWFYSELLSVYQTQFGKTDTLDVVQLGHDLARDQTFATLRQKCSKRWVALMCSASVEESEIRTVLRQSLLLWIKIHASFCRESSTRALQDQHPPSPFLGLLSNEIDHTVKKEEPVKLDTTPSLRLLRESSGFDSDSKVWTFHRFILLFSQRQWELCLPGEEPLALKCQVHSLKKKTVFCRPLLGRQGLFSIVFQGKEHFLVEKLHGPCSDHAAKRKHSALTTPSSRHPAFQVFVTPSNLGLLVKNSHQEVYHVFKPTDLSASKQVIAELVSLSLFLRYRNVCGHFFSSSSHMPARKIYPQSVLLEAAGRGWLTFQGSKQQNCIAALKKLPSVGSLDLNQSDAFVMSPSLYFSVVQDLALVLLFLQHHLPATRRKWLLPLLSSKWHTLWSLPCANKCKVSCFCIDRFAARQSCPASERSNIFPWFNLLLILLARHVALFRIQTADPRKPESSSYLHIVNTNAWVLLLKEVQQLLFLVDEKDTGAFQELDQDQNGDKAHHITLWNRKKLKFEKAWNSYLRTQRFLHLKSYDPNSRFHRYLTTAFEDAKSGRRRKLEIKRKHLWFTQKIKQQQSRGKTKTDFIEKTTLSLHIQKVLETEKTVDKFKVGLFLSNLSRQEGSLPLSRSTSLTRSQPVLEKAPVGCSEVQEHTLLLKHAPLDRSLEAASGVYAQEYLQLVEIFQEANALFMREGNPDQSRRKNTQAHYFHDLLPWPPSVLHCLMYLEQIAALAPRIIGEGQSLISLQVILPPEKTWLCIMVWVLVAHLLLDASVTKAVGDPPCIILVNPKQLYLFELVISVFDALGRVLSFAEKHAVQWVCDKNSSFVLSTKDSTRGSWEYYKRQAVPFPGKRNIIITNSTSDLHPALLEKGFGRVLNLLPLTNPSSPPPVLPSCLVLLDAVPAATTGNAKKGTSFTELALENTPLSVKIELLPELRRGGFLRPSEVGRISSFAVPQVLRVLLEGTQCHEQSTRVSLLSLEKTKLGDFLDLRQETKKKGKKSSQKKEARVQTPTEGEEYLELQDGRKKKTTESKTSPDLQTTLPSPSIPTLGSFLAFLEKNLRQSDTTPKKHYKLFHEHMWPSQARPRVSRENLSTCFYLLRQLLETNRAGDCEIPPLAPRRMRLNLSKYELLLQRSRRESETCCRKTASELASLVPEAQIRRLSVLAGMHLYAILKIQAVALVKKALQDRFAVTEHVVIMTPHEAFGSGEGEAEEHKKPVLVVGTWEEFIEATAAENHKFWVPLQRPSHVFFDESYGNKLKTHLSWIFTNHVHTDIPEDLLSLWSVR